MTVINHPTLSSVQDAPLGAVLVVTTKPMRPNRSGYWTLGCRTFRPSEVLQHSVRTERNSAGNLIAGVRMVKLPTGNWGLEGAQETWFSTDDLIEHSVLDKLSYEDYRTMIARPGTWWFDGHWYVLTPAGLIHRLNDDGSYRRNMDALPRDFTINQGLYRTDSDGHKVPETSYKIEP